MERWRIIAVCQDAEIGQMVDEALGDDYDVLTFKHPSKALKAYEVYQPDLVILGLPVQVASSMIDELGSMNAGQAPVAVIVGDEDSAAIARLYREGAQLCLPQPDSPGRLLRNIKLHFQHSPSSKRRKLLSMSEIRARMEFLGGVTAPGALQLVG